MGLKDLDIFLEDIQDSASNVDFASINKKIKRYWWLTDQLTKESSMAFEDVIEQIYSLMGELKKELDGVPVKTKTSYGFKGYTASARKPGYWQLTYFDDKMTPNGHEEYKDYASGLRDVMEINAPLEPIQSKLKKEDEDNKIVKSHKTITLYRGLENKFNPSHDLTSTDAPRGYSTWTDNPKLAREYAGKNGFVYQIELLKSEEGETFIDDDGERPLFYNSKKAGLNGVSGNEYLVYNDHDDYSHDLVKITNY